jgi:hypothetical protein
MPKTAARKAIEAAARAKAAPVRRKSAGKRPSAIESAGLTGTRFVPV